MNIKQRIARQKQKATLGILVASAILPIGLSFFAEPISTVTLASVAAFMVTLFSGIAWVYPERIHGNANALRHKRRVVIACLAVIASVPLTHWPLRIAFAISRPAMSNTVIKADWLFKKYERGSGESRGFMCGNAPRLWFPNAEINIRARIFYLEYYSTGYDGSIKLYTRGGLKRHSAFRYRAYGKGFSTHNAVDLGGGWQFVELPH